jgi:MFS transporter, PPP family, 3-phenylpropionic acid transporter
VTSKPRSLRTLSALYFFSYGPSGIIYPIFPLLLRSRGFTPSDISWVMVMNPIINLIAPPIWGAIADALHARIALLRIILFGCAASVLLLFPAWGLAGAMLAMLLFCTFRTPIPSLLDAATHAELGDRAVEFAGVRAWGSVSFAIGAGVAGILDASHSASEVVLLSSLLYIGGGATSLRLEAPAMHREPAVLKKTIAHIGRAGLWPLFVANGFYYAAHSVFDVDYSLFLDQLGSRDLVAPSWVLAVVCEVLLMFAASKLLAARSPRNVVLFCAIVAMIRWLLLSVVTSRLLLVGIQSLHAITFGAWYLSLVREAQSSSPEELRSSVQAALLTSMGIGTVFGYIVGGQALEALGGPWMWRLAALSTAVSVVLYAFSSRRVDPIAPPR